MTTTTKSLNPLPNRERIKLPRQHMPEQAANLRNCNFTEVNLGYSPELARQEALRCLECAKPVSSSQFRIPYVIEILGTSVSYDIMQVYCRCIRVPY